MTSRCQKVIACGLGACTVVIEVPTGASAGPLPTAEPPAIALLGNDSRLRAYLAFKAPVFITPDGQVKVALDPMSKEPKPVDDFEPPLPCSRRMRRPSAS